MSEDLSLRHDIDYHGLVDVSSVRTALGLRRLEEDNVFVVYPAERDEVYEIPGRVLVETLRGLGLFGKKARIVGPVARQGERS